MEHAPSLFDHQGRITGMERYVHASVDAVGCCWVRGMLRRSAVEVSEFALKIGEEAAG